jgi:hypothetical protein
MSACPKCAINLDHEQGLMSCPNHGDVVPLWRPESASRESFADLMRLAGQLPVYLPWPMSPGWQISDFGVVAEQREGNSRTLASFTTTTGISDMDGPVAVTLVIEEPGVGLGARCAHTSEVDPGGQFDSGPALAHVRVDGHRVPLWPVDTHHNSPLSAGVLAGEATGRWLWLIMRPASAVLLLRDEWLLADATDLGLESVEMPFGGLGPRGE